MAYQKQAPSSVDFPLGALEVFDQVLLPSPDQAANVGGFDSNDDGLFSGDMSIESKRQRFRLGVGNDVIVIDAIDQTYRLWVGNITPSLAPFRVTKAGVVTATGVTVSNSFTAGETIAAANAIAIGPYQSDGGVTFDAKATVTKNRGTHTTSITDTPITVGNHSNRILLVTIEAQDPSVGAPTWNGTTMSLLYNSGSGGTQFYVYYLLAPAIGANNLTISGLIDSGASLTFYYQVYSYYNVAQSAPTTTTTTSATTASVAQAVTPSANGSLLFTAIAHDAASGSVATVNMTNNAGGGLASGGNFPGYATGDSYKLANTAPITVSATRNSGTATWFMASVNLSPITAPDQRAFKASAADPSNYGWNSKWKSEAFVGFASSGGATGASVDVIISGSAPGLSSLYPSSQYYLSDTAGAIGISAGTNTRKVGIAIDSTRLTITNIW